MIADREVEVEVSSDNVYRIDASTMALINYEVASKKGPLVERSR